MRTTFMRAFGGCDFRVLAASEARRRLSVVVTCRPQTQVYRAPGHRQGGDAAGSARCASSVALYTVPMASKRSEGDACGADATFDERLARLSALVSELEQGSLGLEPAIERYQE